MDGHLIVLHPSSSWFTLLFLSIFSISFLHFISRYNNTLLYSTYVFYQTTEDRVKHLLHPSMFMLKSKYINHLQSFHRYFSNFLTYRSDNSTKAHEEEYLKQASHNCNCSNNFQLSLEGDDLGTSVGNSQLNRAKKQTNIN